MIMTYFLVVLEGEGILLLNKKIGSEDRILISDIRVLLVLGQRLDLRLSGTTRDGDGHTTGNNCQAMTPTEVKWKLTGPSW